MDDIHCLDSDSKSPMPDENINISDVIEVIETDPYFNKSARQARGSKMYQVPGTSAAVDAGHPGRSGRSKPYVEIVEQPASKALRFRYECEGRSAGSIPGAKSTSENKTFPTIRVVGHEKGKKSVVVVSCVTKDTPYRAHPHNLVGREGCRKGVCTLEIPPDTMTMTFSNLGIQCVKKKDIESHLKTREDIRVDPFKKGFHHRNQPTSIDLNAVRLCFQVFIEDAKGKFTVPLDPVVSEPIYDKKAMSDLTIVKLSDCVSPVDGGRKDIILLCEKHYQEWITEETDWFIYNQVAKEDIQIRFFEEKDGMVVWEGLGDFQPSQVHKQTAIWFKTPKYKMINITEPVKVFIQLRRPSDNALSEALPFEFLPLDSGRPPFWSIRRNYTKKGNYSLFNSILANDAELLRKRQLGNLSILGVQNNDQFENVVNNNNNNKFEVININQLESVSNIQTCNNNNNTIDKNQGANNINLSDNNINLNQGGNNNNSNDFENNDIIIIQENTNVLPAYTEIKKNINSADDEIINEVVELDAIYSENQKRLEEFDKIIQLENREETQESFDDAKTYSSLQMAFKNPVQIVDIDIDIDKYEDVIVNPQCPVIDLGALKQPPVTMETEDESEKLPPLPPKRARKVIETDICDVDVNAIDSNFNSSAVNLNSSLNLNASKTSLKNASNQSLMNSNLSNVKTSSSININGSSNHDLSGLNLTGEQAENLLCSTNTTPIVLSRSHSFRSQNELLPPSKKLPPKPCSSSTLPNPKKRSFFSKLFGKKEKPEHAKRHSLSQLSTNSDMNRSSNSNLNAPSLNRTPSTRSALSVRIPLKGSLTSLNDLSGKNQLNNLNNNGLSGNENIIEDDDFNMNLDLTEAEHYALYTAMAPHATQSEFDEMSAYYAPVEGGKLLTDAEVMMRLSENKT